MSRRRQQALSQNTECPETLQPSNEIVQVKSSQGQYLYMVENCLGVEYLVELPSRFRNVAWIKRGGFVVVELLESSDIKIKGNIVEVVRDLKKWRSMGYWPDEFKAVNKDDSEERDMWPKSSDEETE